MNEGISDGAGWCSLVLAHRAFARGLGCTFFRPVYLGIRSVWNFGTLGINLHSEAAPFVFGGQKLRRHFATFLLYKPNAFARECKPQSMEDFDSSYVFHVDPNAGIDAGSSDGWGRLFQPYFRAMALLDHPSSAGIARIMCGGLVCSNVPDNMEYWAKLLCVTGDCQFSTHRRALLVRKEGISYVCGQGALAVDPGDLVV